MLRLVNILLAKSWRICKNFQIYLYLLRLINTCGSMSQIKYFILYKIIHDFDQEWNWKNVKVISIYNKFDDFKAKYVGYKPSTMQPGMDFRFFREKVKPNWDDPCNEGGGRFILTKLEQLDDEDFDHLWLEIVKFMMTSDADEVDYVAGALVKCRSNPTRRTISIWTMGNINHSNRLEIGELLKTHLHLDENIYFGFHSELGQRALIKRGR